MTEQGEHRKERGGGGRTARKVFHFPWETPREPAGDADSVLKGCGDDDRHWTTRGRHWLGFGCH